MRGVFPPILTEEFGNETETFYDFTISVTDRWTQNSRPCLDTPRNVECPRFLHDRRTGARLIRGDTPTAAPPFAWKDRRNIGSAISGD